jgi:hypothetical protein
MTTTTAAPAAIFTELATIHGFMRATAGDVPSPSSITVHGGTYPTAHLLFDSLEDLREWAAYLQVSVEARDVRPQYDAIHHRASAMWGPTHGKVVEFEMVYIEHVPKPLPVETYSCEHCGASFGIAGGFTGSNEDCAAEEHYREEVERHESGACVGPRTPEGSAR